MTVEWFGDSLERKVRNGLMLGIAQCAEMVRNEAIRSILQDPKTGRLYTRGGVVHQASAAYEAPASDTGRLVSSITADHDYANIVSKVTARTEYAAYLEFGTQHMEPRPFMRPAVASQLVNFGPTIQAELDFLLR